MTKQAKRGYTVIAFELWRHMDCHEGKVGKDKGWHQNGDSNYATSARSLWCSKTRNIPGSSFTYREAMRASHIQQLHAQKMHRESVRLTNARPFVNAMGHRTKFRTSGQGWAAFVDLQCISSAADDLPQKSKGSACVLCMCAAVTV